MAALNDKQMEFARLVVSGMSKPEAYRKAFNRKEMSGVAASKAASRLSKREEVVAHMDRLRREADTKAVLSRQERMQWLSARVRECGEGGDVRAGVACIAELNKMDGAYEPEKKEVAMLGGFAALMGELNKDV